MLVLTRRLNQTIVIEVRGDQVRLGISAPREKSVHRAEVYRQIQQENRSTMEIGRADWK